MAQHSIRFPDALDAQLQHQAEVSGRSFSNIVIRLCLQALPDTSERVSEDQVTERPPRIEDKPVSKISPVPKPPDPMRWRCPAPRCGKLFGSPAAVCPLHGRRAVPV